MTKYCKNCGAKNRDEACFCGNCGKKLRMKPETKKKIGLIGLCLLFFILFVCSTIYIDNIEDRNYYLEAKIERMEEEHTANSDTDGIYYYNELFKICPFIVTADIKLVNNNNETNTWSHNLQPQIEYYCFKGGNFYIGIQLVAPNGKILIDNGEYYNIDFEKGEKDILTLPPFHNYVDDEEIYSGTYTIRVWCNGVLLKTKKVTIIKI
ncbi:MAG: zinc ribbon domain-containing protein [Bacteroidales bacterium]|nr:zinc ribbon domain-containing protein [Bacteroidales bacterium]